MPGTSESTRDKSVVPAPMPPKLLDRLVLTLVYLLTHAHVLKRAVGALTVPGIEVAIQKV